MRQIIVFFHEWDVELCQRVEDQMCSDESCSKNDT